MISKFLLPYDIYERHKKVGSFIEYNQSVLDVGGALNHLIHFCNPRKIVVANLEGSEKSDLIIKKGKLPFGQNSFDVVCAIDVLEHLPGKKRKEFIEDLVRVAKNKVVLSFPIGTEDHVKYEKEMLSWLKTKNQDLKYLQEHIKFKLPTFEQIENWTENKKIILKFSGNININEYLFKLYLTDPRIKYVRKLMYFFKLFFNLTTNQLFYLVLTERKFQSSVNRAYLVIEK